MSIFACPRSRRVSHSNRCRDCSSRSHDSVPRSRKPSRTTGEAGCGAPGACRATRGRSRVIVEFTASPRRPGDHPQTRSRGPPAPEATPPGRRRSTTTALTALAADPRVARVMIDRPVFPTLFAPGQRTGAAHRPTAVRCDSDAASASPSSIQASPAGTTTSPRRRRQPHHDRIAHFKDFTQAAIRRHRASSDEYGHGTHVAGIAGRLGPRLRRQAHRHRSRCAHLIGSQSARRRRTRATSATSLPRSTTRWTIKDAFNIRIINLSVASGVFESLQARSADAGRQARRRCGHRRRRGGRQSRHQRRGPGAVRRRHVAGKLALGADGRRQHSHQGTARRSDDAIGELQLTRADVDRLRGQARPRRARSRHRVALRIQTARCCSARTRVTCSARTSASWRQAVSEPERHQHGGALSWPAPLRCMLEANPELTPNAVKAILQYTAQSREGRRVTARPGCGPRQRARRCASWRASSPRRETTLQTVDVIEGEPVAWSRQIIWGNYRVTAEAAASGCECLDERTDLGIACSCAATSRSSGAHVQLTTGTSNWSSTARRWCSPPRTAQHRLGHRRSRQHRVGRRGGPRRTSSGRPGGRRQHRLGDRRPRQHRVGHAATAATSSGPPATATTSSGRPEAATTSSGRRADRNNIVWATASARTWSGVTTAAATTASASCGARDRTAQCGALRSRPITSCGPRTTAATSSGPRRIAATSSGPQQAAATSSGPQRTAAISSGPQAAGRRRRPCGRPQRPPQCSWADTPLIDQVSHATYPRYRSDNERTRHDHLAAGRNPVGLVRWPS